VILVDTSIWIAHFRAADEALRGQLATQNVMTHPFIIGELAVGHLHQRDIILAELHRLPRSEAASASEVLHFIDQERLMGLGIGYVDAHLLAAVRLTRGATLWTRDRRLAEVADRLGLAFRTSG
jgi:predicted nucleic acid-binding protein